MCLQANLFTKDLSTLLFIFHTLAGFAESLLLIFILKDNTRSDGSILGGKC